MEQHKPECKNGIVEFIGNDKRAVARTNPCTCSESIENQCPPTTKREEKCVGHDWRSQKTSDGVIVCNQCGDMKTLTQPELDAPSTREIESVEWTERFDAKFGGQSSRIAFKTWEDLDAVKSFIAQEIQSAFEAGRAEANAECMKDFCLKKEGYTTGVNDAHKVVAEIINKCPCDSECNNCLRVHDAIDAISTLLK